MKVRVELDDKKVERLVGSLALSGKYLEDSVENMADELGQIAKGAVLTAIYNQMSNPEIGRFMFNRTDVKVSFSKGVAVLNVTGLPEGSVPNPARSDGTIPQVSSPNVNLWMTHEFGVPTSGGDSQKMVYEKDDGGVKVVRNGAAYGMGSPYVGEIRGIIAGIGPALERAFRVFAKGKAYAAMGQVLKVGGMDINVNAFALSKIRDMGGDLSSLKKLGIDKVDVTARGQINYLGSNPGGTRRFISGKAEGLPTTIR